MSQRPPLLYTILLSGCVNVILPVFALMHLLRYVLPKVISLPCFCILIVQDSVLLITGMQYIDLCLSYMHQLYKLNIGHQISTHG